MNIYKKLYYLLYSLVLKTPSKDESPYFIANITLSGILAFNIFLIIEIFFKTNWISFYQKGFVLILYVLLTAFNYIYFYKSFKKNNIRDVKFLSLEFLILGFLVVMPIVLISLHRKGMV